MVTSNKIQNKKSAIIKEIRGDIGFVSRLREMGFGENMTITKASDDAQRCIILNVKGTKIWLTEGAAECILVEIL
jgi:Fe2+ transport system protein FeoA